MSYTLNCGQIIGRLGEVFFLCEKKLGHAEPEHSNYRYQAIQKSRAGKLGIVIEEERGRNDDSCSQR
jgi:hypothetical protein